MGHWQSDRGGSMTVKERLKTLATSRRKAARTPAPPTATLVTSAAERQVTPPDPARVSRIRVRTQADAVWRKRD